MCGRRTVAIGLVVTLLLATASWACAQGLLVATEPGHSYRLPRPIMIWPPYPPYPHPHPRPIPPPPPPPPATYKIQELDVQAKLADQVAQVQVSQTFVNTGSVPLEVSFLFPLPYDGAIDRMTLLVDGKEFPAKLLKADEARRLYESIVRKNKDPALLEWMGAGAFQTSVFPVPPGAKRTVSLRYSQLCRSQDGLTDFLFPMSTAKYTSEAVEQVNVRINVESSDDIKNIYSPTHAIEIKRPDPRHAVAVYSAKREIPSSDFRLFYDVGKGKVSTRVISYRPERDGDRDGYFMLLASPEIKSAGAERAKKTVLFAIDRSGSMSGKKIEQVKSAMKFVLENLHQGDLFNVIAYDSEVESFRPELQRYDDQTRKAALTFVDGLYAGGSTNIDGALKASLGQLQDSSRPTYLVFLTDGLPTTGVTGEMQIVANAKQNNRVRARIFAFGVGYDVNARLLDKLVRETHGQSEYVRPNEDIEDRVSKLYRRIEAPVMTDVNLEFAVDRQSGGGVVNRVYPKGIVDLFAGEQWVVVGRYKTPGSAKVVVQGTVDGRPQKFDFPANLVQHSADDTNAFIEKLWAVRRVGEIIDEIDLKGKNDELVKELVELATRHGIVTPYTSFLADESTNLREVTANVDRANLRLLSLEATSGVVGVEQRRLKQQMQNAYGLAKSDAYPGMSGGYPGMSAGARPAEGAMGGMGGMMGSGGMGSSSAGPALSSQAGRRMDASRRAGGAMPGIAATASVASAGRDSMQQAAAEMDQAGQNVRNVGNKAFFRRGAQWVDSSVSTAQENNAQRVKQFSDEYFRLAKAHGRTLSQYLVFDEPVLLNLAEKTFLIEP